MGYGSGYAPSRDTSPRYCPTTGKRLKQNFGTHANTAHAWAQNKHSYGRASDGRIFFHGRNIYSYGLHFCMASITDKTHNGKTVVLINPASYSISTSAHQGEVLGALRGLDVVTVDVPDLDKLCRYDECKDIPADTLAGMFRSCVRSLGQCLADCATLNRDEWRRDYDASRLANARLELETLRKVFKVKTKVPADPVAWVARQDALAAAAKRKAKIADAKVTARKASIPNEWLTPDPAFNSYRLNQTAEHIGRQLTKARSARTTLGRKNYPGLVSQLSATIRALATLKDAWTAAYDDKRSAELRSDRMEKMRDYRKQLKAGKSLGWYARDLIGFAYREGFKDVAAAIQAEVHLDELRGHYDRQERYVSKIEERITPEQWKNGKGGASLYSCSDTLVRRRGDRLETSRGAVAPWRKCVGAFLIAQNCMMTRTTWHKNGTTHNLGTYELDRIEANGDLVAGCHRIKWAEMLRLAVRECPEVVRPLYPLPVVIA